MTSPHAEPPSAVEADRVPWLEELRVVTRAAIARVDENSPEQPYLSFTFEWQNLRRLVIKILSKDQGPDDHQILRRKGLDANSHILFACGRIDGSDNELLAADAELHSSLSAAGASGGLTCRTLAWDTNDTNEENSDLQTFLESISPSSGSTIGVFPRVKGTGWSTTIHQMEVQLFEGRALLPSSHNQNIGFVGTAYPTNNHQPDESMPSTRFTVEALITRDDCIAFALSQTAAAHVHGVRFDRTGDVAELGHGLFAAQQALRYAPRDWPRYHEILAAIGALWARKYISSQRMPFLDLAVSETTRAVELGRANASAILHIYLGDLAGFHYMLYEEKGTESDLEKAITLATEVGELFPKGDLNLVIQKSHLARYLLSKHIDANDESNDVFDKALDLAREAVLMLHESDHRMALCLNTLVGCLLNKFERTRSETDLDEAISTFDRALRIGSQPSHHRALLLVNSAKLLIARFRIARSVNDLSQVINTSMMASNTISPESNLHSEHLDLVATALRLRYDYTNSIMDIVRAIDAAQKAKDAAREDQACYASRLGNLGSCYGFRYRRSRMPEDLDQAIDYSEQALNASPKAKADSARSNLASWLRRRSELTKSYNDLEKAISLVRQVTISSSLESMDDAKTLELLAICLQMRYGRDKEPQDLDEAIQSTSQAIKKAPNDTQTLGELSLLQAQLYEELFKRTPDDTLLQARLSALMRAWNCRGLPPTERAIAARDAAAHHAGMGSWMEANNMFKEALYLIPKMSPRSLHQTDIQMSMGATSGVGTNVVATALKLRDEQQDVQQQADSDAELLQLLELGRGVAANVLIGMRSDVSNLAAVHKDLSDRFLSLRSELNNGMTDIITGPGDDRDLSPWTSEFERRYAAEEELELVIQEIRAQPGFGGFLQPPRADELLATAKNGPLIVINISPYRCDAFLVQSSRLWTLELPDLSAADVDIWASRTKTSACNFSSLLEWLWNTTCRPCLDALGLTEPHDKDWQRVWWIPTGRLCELPLHAAGLLSRNSRESVLDRVISSYASSIKTLQHGRQQLARVQEESDAPGKALLVAMPETPPEGGKYKRLGEAEKEVAKVKEYCPSLHLTPVIPDRVVKSDVITHLVDCKIFHFAGHGDSDVDPNASLIVLKDWQDDPLTVGNLLEQWAQREPPFLAFLSACSTVSNTAKPLADEAIHLVNAFQLAGFQHVIGTLWEVSDPHCLEVTKVLYETMKQHGMTSEAVSLGLHKALLKLRKTSLDEGATRFGEELDEDEEGPMRRVAMMDTYWIPYVHFGI